MTFVAPGSVLGGLPLEGESHFPPAPQDFWQPLFEIGNTGYFFTRSMATAILSVIILSVWLLHIARKAQVVPTKGQWLTELVYNFARNDVARDMIGVKDFFRFVPFIFALFVFLLLNNLFGIVPGVQMPTTARVAYPIMLTVMVYVIYHWVGVRRRGGVVKYMLWMIPPGMPGWLRPFVFVLELANFLVNRPLTLALRLFGNMFAGHMLLIVFIVGGYELFTSDAMALKLVAVPAWIMAAVMTAFEALIQVLQAYIFALLAASYFSDAVSEGH